MDDLESLREDENLSMVLVDFIKDMPGGMLIYKADESEKIVYASNSLIKLFECDTMEEFMVHTKASFRGIVHPDDLDAVESDIQVQVQNSGEARVDYVMYRIITAKGKVKWVLDYGHLVDSEKYGKAYFVVICEDIYDQSSTAKRHMQALVNEVTWDHLTGLYDRAYGEKYITRRIESPDFAGGLFVVLDIDNFKRVNDRLGHKKGDETLMALSHQMKAWARDDAMVCRAGGDEFIIFLPDDEESEKRLEELATIVRARLKENDRYVQISASIGVARTPQYGRTFVELYEKADHAMSQAKNYGKDRIVYYQGEDLSEGDTESLLAAFSEALKKKYIKVYYQPVIRTISNNVCGMEALARWIDPVLGFMPPNKFIPLLEKSRRIQELDLYMLREICSALHDAQINNEGIVPVSFNLSRYDFIACDIFSEVEALVEEFDIPRDFLNVEITESMVMENPELMKNEVTKFRNAGYQVWMDDFGSGYSSLNALKDYSFDEIKLDMLFMRGLDEKSKKIIMSIISMAKKIGVHTLAEGVETREQYEFLRDLGCEKVQGYYIGKPSPLMETMNNIQSQQRGLEGRGWRKYYDTLVDVDFMTERPLGVIDFFDGKMQCLFANDVFRDVWKTAGVTDIDEIFERLNCGFLTFGNVLRDFLKSRKIGDDYGDFDHLVYGQYMRMRIKCISSYREHILFLLDVVNLSRSDLHDEQERDARIYHAISNTFDRLLLLDLDNNKVKPIVHGGSGASVISDDVIESTPVDEFFALVANNYIHKEHRSEFLAWADVPELVKSLKTSDWGTAKRYFRTKISNGAYVWMAHCMLYLQSSNSLVYFVQTAPLSETGLVTALNESISEAKVDTAEEVLCKNLLYNSKIINLFWKDAERRFLGANQKFMDVYGFESPDEFVGKTDEEMHWHIDDIPFQRDELDVIYNGKIIQNQPGKCIIDGRTYDILASKEPMYKDGKIVGLVGYFIPLKKEMGLSGGEGDMLLKDAVSGLLSASSMMNIMIDYVDNWERREEEFFVINIRVDQYLRLVKTYGEDVGNALLREIGKIILEEVRVTGNAARIHSGNFVVVMKLSLNEINAFMKKVDERIRAIHEVEGFRVTLKPVITMTGASEVANIWDIMRY